MSAKTGKLKIDPPSSEEFPGKKSGIPGYTIGWAIVAVLVIGSFVYRSTRPRGPSADSLKASAARGRSLDSAVEGAGNGGAGAEPGPSENGYQEVGFQYLSSFTYTPREDVGIQKGQIDTGQIPERIRRLSGKAVRVEGFMIPVDQNSAGKVSSFLLAKNQQQCCYGQAANWNDWILVRMPEGKEVFPRMDEWLRVMGTLEVGEEVVDGYLTSIYRMKADHVGPKP